MMLLAPPIADAQTPSSNSDVITDGMTSGIDMIPTDLPTHATSTPSGNGPVSLLPGTIPANHNGLTEDEIPSLATQYHQTLTGNAPARRNQPAAKSTPSKPTAQPQPMARSLAPTAPSPTVVTTTPAQATVGPPPISPVETAAPAVTGPYLIQLGAFRDAVLAETYWASFKIRYPDLADTHGKQITTADLGENGIYHRLQLTGFATSEMAKQKCRQLAADGTDCFAAYP
jgi:cell division septation protein DedD